MESYSLKKTLLKKCDQFCKAQGSQTNAKGVYINSIFHSLMGGSLIYTQIYRQSDITLAIDKLSRYLKNPRPKYWQTAKRVLRYL